MTAARRFIAERRRGLLWWAVGIAGLVLFTVAFYPSVRGQTSFDEVYEDLPDALRAMLGTAADLGITTAPGYLQGRLFGSLLPLVLLVLAIGTSVRATAGAEDDGTLEQLAILPLTRRRLYLERATAAIVITAGAGAVAFLALLTLGRPFGATDGIATANLLAATAGATALAVFHAGLALCLGSATGRRALTTATTTGVAVAGFLFQGLLAASDAPPWTRWTSPWHWYLRQPAVIDGWTPAMLATPLIGALLLIAVGAARFDRRDLR